MGLSPDLVASFAKIIAGDKNTDTERIVYGTVVEQDNVQYVRIDGSSLLTPISNTVEVKDGERVTIMLKNHSAVVTGNLSSPAVRSETVQILISDVANIEEVLLGIEIVSPEAFLAAVERIDTLEDAHAELDVEVQTLTEAVETNTSDITTLKENVVDFQALFETMQAELDGLKERVTKLES